MSVPYSELPNPVSPNELTSENPFALVITKQTYDRLLRAKHPVFSHATYYEGGRFIIFDPTVGKTLVAIEWNI